MAQLGHSLGTVGAKIENSRANLEHSRSTAGAQSYLGHCWGTVEAEAVGAQLRHSWGTVGANLRTDDEGKVSLGTVEAHLGQTFLLGTVGAGLRLRLLSR